MKDKRLELIVIPQHGSQGQTTTSNLSGGERSFSTVAFLHALWQCMDFPFYILDEFDVYMVSFLVLNELFLMGDFRINWIGLKYLIFYYIMPEIIQIYSLSF